MKLSVDKNISLELLNVSHADNLFRVTDENRTFLRKWLGWVDFTESVKITNQFSKDTVNNVHGNKGFQFVIKYKSEIAGMIGIVEIRKFWNSAEIGYWLAEKFNGKGIMTNSAKKLVDYCFDELYFHSVIIRCNVSNKASKGIPERLGFFKQGILKKDGLRNGKYVNHLQYIMRKNDWDNKNCKTYIP